jgi:hypothetical protein
MVFVGSASGDSQVCPPSLPPFLLHTCISSLPPSLPPSLPQLVRLNTERDTAGSYLSVEASYLNIAPILDMCLLAENNSGSNGTYPSLPPSLPHSLPPFLPPSTSLSLL